MAMKPETRDDKLRRLKDALLECAAEIERDVPLYGMFTDAERDYIGKLAVRIRSEALDLPASLRVGRPSSVEAARKVTR